jgi:hypothetical protein
MSNCNIEEKGSNGISFLDQRLGKVKSLRNTNLRVDRTENEGSGISILDDGPNPIAYLRILRNS